MKVPHNVIPRKCISEDFVSYSFNDKIKEDKMDATCSRYDRYKEQLRISGQKDNIRIILKLIWKNTH
jgi:hypothetical protein